MMVKIDSSNYNMHMASCIPSLEVQYKWIITATPLVYGIEVLRLILQFLESSYWLTLQLLPDTLDYTFNIDDNWVTDSTYGSCTEHGVRYTHIVDQYKTGPAFESPVHWTTMMWDT